MKNGLHIRDLSLVWKHPTFYYILGLVILFILDLCGVLPLCTPIYYNFLLFGLMMVYAAYTYTRKYRLTYHHGTVSYRMDGYNLDLDPKTISEAWLDRDRQFHIVRINREDVIDFSFLSDKDIERHHKFFLEKTDVSVTELNPDMSRG